jgi:tRNA uridine 5-carbamoylmethylation protein Kti12
MLIITSGLPSAGKSRTIDFLSKSDGTWHIIRPSDWVPDNLSSLSDENQRQYNIGCWSMAIDKTREAISEVPPNEFIVLDSCNSKHTTLLTIITDAKAAMHEVALLFVQSNIELCLARDSKLTEPLLRDYANRFKTSLPHYKKSCDLFLVVRNNGTLEQLKTELHDVWKKLCQNT